MSDQPNWVRRCLKQLAACLELESLGGISWRLVDEDGLLIVAPSVIEVIGGRDDGAAVYTMFHLDVSELIPTFDTVPSIHWSSREQTLSLEGRIEAEAAWIEVRSEPFDDEGPQFHLYEDGSLGAT